MFCPNPNCFDLVEGGVRGEYVDGITICPTCGAGLVDSAALDALVGPEMADGDIEVETVFVSADTTEIAVVRSLLEGAGIPFLLDGLADQEYLGLGQAGIGIGGRGGVGVRVRAADAEAVRAMLVEQDLQEESDHDAGE